MFRSPTTRIRFLLLSLTGLAGLFPYAPSRAASAPDRPGVLLLAHGGQLQWNEDVRHLADQVDLSVPTEIAFGMATPRTIQEAINRLNARGVTRIVAVPLFVSSYSSVIASTEYLLGLRPDAPPDLAMFASMDHTAMDNAGMAMDHAPAAAVQPEHAAVKPVVSKVPVSMTSALNHHEIVASILLDRAASVSANPANEVVILVAHGPVPDDDNRKWLTDLGMLADQMRKSSNYSEIQYMTLRDDADDPVRKQASEELRHRVEEARARDKTVLLIPVLLAYGGVEGGIRKRLEGLDYRMPAQGLLPDNRIVHWVLTEEQAIAPKPSHP